MFVFLYNVFILAFLVWALWNCWVIHSLSRLGFFFFTRWCFSDFPVFLWFVHSHCCVIFHCPFCGWWALTIFPHFGFDEWCCYARVCTQLLMHTCKLSPGVELQDHRVHARLTCYRTKIPFHGAYCVPSAVVSVLHMLICLILVTTLWD